MQPGVYKDIPEDQYHALHYLGSSTLKRFADNPYESQQPFVPGDLLQKTLDMGSAIHKLALEGRPAYEKEFAVAPQCDKRTKEGKQVWSDFVASCDGRRALDQEQSERIEGMYESLKQHPNSSVMLGRGANELTVIWEDEPTGLRCKARLDDYSHGVVNDLKSCGDILKFHRDLYARHYPLQQMHYTAGALANDLKVDGFVFIAVQSSKTYGVRTGMLTMESMEKAQAEYRRLMGLYSECHVLKFWPNYRLPKHLYSINQITQFDLLEDW